MNLAAAPYALFISRTIDAPRQKIFRPRSEPALLVQGWGPQGMPD
ncbi:activator of HSP90 ATPase [Pseudomonas fluorescens]|uniref:Activator of HSP90 ATPase n=1 Tax=Pseudomonas fluorescens TaxID=294 RepID=A0A165ZBG6_PSEFL|nr:activator of HSP90 ATPase [Pseudomonas fluorescens]